MSKTATLKWTDAPTATSNEIALQAQGAPDFTVLDPVAQGVQTATIPDLPNGNYTVKVTAISAAGRAAGITATFTVSDTVVPAPPADVTGLTVTLA